MKKRDGRLKIILSFIWILVAGPASGMYPITRNFTKNAYHAGTQNWMMLQSPGGCLYAANNSGLLEYDGDKWELYPVAGNTLRSLFFDEQHDRLYVGSFEDVGYFSLESGTMAYTRVADSLAARGAGEIWNILRAGNALYFQGDDRILRLEQDELSRFQVEGRISSSASVANTIFITTPRQGALVLTGDIFMTLPGSELLVDRHVCAILEYGTDILFVTDLDGLFSYDGTRISQFRVPASASFPTGRIFCADLRGNTLALGTVADGLWVVDLGDGNTIHVENGSGLQNNTVLSLCFDNDDNLWLGLDKGIDYVMINFPEFSLFPSEDRYGSGYASLLYNDRLYLGTNQGLLVGEFGRRGRNVSVDGIAPVEHMQGQVWKLVLIGDDIFCCHDRGLFLVSGNRASRIEGLPEGIWNIIELTDREDTALGCSYSGFFILRRQDGRWRMTNYVSGFEEAGGTFLQASDGVIWFSHWIKGLFRLTLNSNSDRFDVEYYGTGKGLPTDRNNLPFRYGGGIVVSTEGGFFKFDQARNRMMPVQYLNNMFSGTPIAMRLWESPYNDLIFTSASFFGIASQDERGVHRIDSMSLDMLKDKLILGFEDILFIDENNYLVSTENGFSLVDPRKVFAMSSGSRQGNLFIKKIYITTERDSLVAESRGTSVPMQSGPIPHRNNSLRFEFASPEYISEGLVGYSCFLDGFDRTWSDFTASNVKEYTGLPHGKYTLDVRASNPLAGGFLTTRYSFEILPPWYASTWAYGLYSVLGLLGLWGVVLLFDRRSLARVSEVERIKEKEIKEQKNRYEADARVREKEIVLLRNQTLEYDLKIKSQELASSTLNLIRKNEILLKIRDDLNSIFPSISARHDPAKIMKELMKIHKEIRENIEHDNDWKKFEQNFDLVYENYLKRLSERFPRLNMNDKKLCAFLRMDLQSKDIAPLMNISVRSVEMARYRLRSKMGLSRDVNLSEFLQKF